MRRGDGQHLRRAAPRRVARHFQHVDRGRLDREVDQVLQLPARSLAPLLAWQLGRVQRHQPVGGARQHGNVAVALQRAAAAQRTQCAADVGPVAAVDPVHPGPPITALHARQQGPGALRHAGHPSGQRVSTGQGQHDAVRKLRCGIVSSGGRPGWLEKKGVGGPDSWVGGAARRAACAAPPLPPRRPNPQRHAGAANAVPSRIGTVVLDLPPAAGRRGTLPKPEPGPRAGHHGPGPA